MPAPLRPTFARWNREGGHWQWGLDPVTFARIEAGYGCGYCLEPFEHWVPVCYICGQPNEVTEPGPLPEEWKKQGG